MKPQRLKLINLVASGGMPDSSGYPMFDGRIEFIDTAYLAQVSFNDRNKLSSGKRIYGCTRCFL